MRKRGIFVCACLISMVAGAVTNVFEMPLLYPKHLALQQRLMRVVRTGETEEMERICREGVALLPRDPTWQYNLACALAYRADKGEALAALDRAIDLGFRDAAAIEADRDLKSLGPIKAFRKLLDKARRLQGKPVEGMPSVRPVSVVMGRPAEVNAENTIWDFEFGCFRTRFNLLVPDLRPVSDYAEAYRGAAAEAVRAGFKAGTASGNFGDLYVNRDGNHSLLVVSNYPGLTPVVYGEQAKQAQVHLSLPNGLFDAPVLGNASLSMVSGPYWRSLPRAAVTDPLRAIISLRFYLGNQIWVFPEHRDHDPETGDLYPVNAPFFVISQGSSGSDQPFVNAFAATLAAFTPATKRTLTQRNRIGPTLQRILRITQKAVAKGRGAYLTVRRIRCIRCSATGCRGHGAGGAGHDAGGDPALGGASDSGGCQGSGGFGFLRPALRGAVRYALLHRAGCARRVPRAGDDRGGRSARSAAGRGLPLDRVAGRHPENCHHASERQTPRV